jgi:hypothetical protein
MPDEEVERLRSMLVHAYERGSFSDKMARKLFPRITIRIKKKSVVRKIKNEKSQDGA